MPNFYQIYKFIKYINLLKDLSFEGL